MVPAAAGATNDRPATAIRGPVTSSSPHPGGTRSARPWPTQPGRCGKARPGPRQWSSLSPPTSGSGPEDNRPPPWSRRRNTADAGPRRTPWRAAARCVDGRSPRSSRTRWSRAKPRRSQPRPRSRSTTSTPYQKSYGIPSSTWPPTRPPSRPSGRPGPPIGGPGPRPSKEKSLARLRQLPKSLRKILFRGSKSGEFVHWALFQEMIEESGHADREYMERSSKASM